MTKIDIAVLKQQVENTYKNLNTIEMISQPSVQNGDYNELTIRTKAHSKDVRVLMEKLSDLLSYLNNDAFPTD